MIYGHAHTYTHKHTNTYTNAISYTSMRASNQQWQHIL